MNENEMKALEAAQTIEDYCHTRKECAGCLFDRGTCILRETDTPSLWLIEDLVQGCWNEEYIEK